MSATRGVVNQVSVTGPITLGDLRWLVAQCEGRRMTLGCLFRGARSTTRLTMTRTRSPFMVGRSRRRDEQVRNR
jgi:hypothetical protein